MQWEEGTDVRAWFTEVQGSALTKRLQNKKLQVELKGIKANSGSDKANTRDKQKAPPLACRPPSC